ncbi:MAG TPA: lactate racemase domain-containing protein [Chloroflexota bacterium]|nr:lactate racemase domain-containing protein [Chloroflexota bacterium]
MPSWTLDWQRGPVEVSVPDANLQTVIRAPALPTLGTPEELVTRALDHPIGCPPLEQQITPGSRVAVLVSDMHDRLFGTGDLERAVLDRLNRRGISDEQITLVHAAGLHGHHGGRSKIGERVLGRVRYVEHDPLDESALVFRGVTRLGTPVFLNRVVAEADFVLGIGSCSPSLYGYQGGAGIILPGVAGADTIRRNHTMIMSTRTASCWWPDNPQRQDVMDAGDLAGLRLKIDFTANTVFAGAFREEWPAAVRYLQSHFMVPTEPADLTIFAPAGNGAELMSMYQQLELAEETTHRGGMIIACISASAHEPLSRRPLSETMEEFLYCTRMWARETGDDNPLRAHWRRRDMVCKEELLAHPLAEISRVVARMQGEPRSTTHVWSHRRCLERKRTILVTEGVTPEEGARMGFALVTNSFESALARAFDALGPNARINVNLPPDKGFPYVADPE